ncbi:PPAN isoform 2, partial [Pongo abelii]
AEPDGDHNITELPQAVAGRGNMRAQQSAVRLTEIGPRMTLQLIKVQEGVGEGKVMFHSFVRKTEEELQAILEAKEKKLRLKAQRQAQQAQNVQRKQEQREAHRKKSLEGMKKARVRGGDEEASGIPSRTASLGLDLFPEAKRKRLAKSPGQKRKRREMDRGRGRLCDQKFPKPKDKSHGAQARRGPRGASQDGGRGQGRGRPRKRVA